MQLQCSFAAVFFLLAAASVFFATFLFFVAAALPCLVPIVSGADLAMGLLVMMKSGSGNGPRCCESKLG